jgi:glycerophosphoryl diester phosphodiesterase
MSKLNRWLIPCNHLNWRFIQLQFPDADFDDTQRDYVPAALSRPWLVMAIKLPHALERVAQQLADIWFLLIPRRRPSRQALHDCKIISHRGEHDNRQVKENTLAAFARVAEAGGWGIEFDVRWTRDLQPVVIHDSSTARVFGIDLEVAAVDLHELQQQVPGIPTLEEVVARFGGNTHLMVELKRDELGAVAGRAARLGEIFATLIAAEDYHFLALQLDLFKLVEFAGDKACLPVAELNLGNFSHDALTRDLGGVCGQYLLLNQGLIQRHHRQGQKLGTGFIGSRFCFYRELNRGVDWVFTNHALKLETIRQGLLQQ